MITVIFRVIRYGAQNFYRNSLLSIATIAVMVIALVAFFGLRISNVALISTLESIKDKIDITVFFKIETKEDDILRIKKSLEGFAEVKSVEYVSRDNALEKFKLKHTDVKIISEALNELDDNPFSASLNVKAHDPSKYSIIAGYLDTSEITPLTDKITYAQNHMIIDRLSRIISAVESGGYILGVILSIVAGLIVFNTIRLSIYSNREEIAVMRLVGASNAFIRGPYLITGVLYGLIATVFSFAIVVPVLIYISPYFKDFVPSLDIIFYLKSNILVILLTQLSIGVGLGTIFSFLAMRRYLKV